MRGWLALGLMVGLAGSAAAQVRENGVRMETWQPGNASAFEAGYARHLEWRHQQADPWVWYGWTILTGDRVGTFIDASFFHGWPEFDRQGLQDADRGDAPENLLPNAQLRNVASYELLPPYSSMTAADVTAPYLGILTLHLRPGSEAAVDHVGTTLLRSMQTAHALLRPVSGSTDYLLLIPVRYQADQAWMGELFRKLIAALPVETVLDSRVEFARFRPELSYAPH